MQFFKTLCILSFLALPLNVSTHAEEIVDENSNSKQMAIYRREIKYLLNFLTYPIVGSALYEDLIFQQFLSGLKFHKVPSLQVTRILKLATEHLIDRYEGEFDFLVQGRIIGALDRLNREALLYSVKHNNKILNAYFLNVSSYLAKAYPQVEKNTEDDTVQFKVERQNQRDVLEIKIEKFLKYMPDYIKNSSEIFGFRGSTIEISFQEVPVSKKIHNVSFFDPKNNRKKVYTVKILNATVDSREAVSLATQTLLKSDLVYGVSFENRSRIPSDLQNDSYELFSWGSNILLKRPSCSHLFYKVL